MLSVDVCVIGGGPAGSAFARRLQQLGHTTALVERAQFPRCHIGVSLAASALPLLDILDVRNAAMSASVSATSTIVYWANRAEVRQQPAGSCHVDRAIFDSALLDAAQTAGAMVLQPASIRTATRGIAGWSILVETASSTVELHAQIVVDAAGRSSFLHFPRIRATQRTIALFAFWRGISTEAKTVMATSDSAWYWVAKLPRDESVVTIFLDAADYRLRFQQLGNKGAVYDGLLIESIFSRLDRRARISEVRICDATPFLRARVAGNDFISVGESAFAIDPISSQGIVAAIGSSIHAAIVVNTILRHPESRDLALRFYEERISKSHGIHQRLANNFYSTGASAFKTSFWRDRELPEQKTNAQPISFLKHICSSTILSIAPGVRVFSSAATLDDRIIAVDAVDAPSLSKPIVYLQGVPLAPLLQMVDEPASVEEIQKRWRRRVSEQFATTLLYWTLEHQILISTPESRLLRDWENPAATLLEDHSSEHPICLPTASPTIHGLPNTYRPT